MKDKRNKRKNLIGSPRKSPLKNKLLSSPAKTLPGAYGSPQKLMDGFLQHEGMASERPLVTGTKYWLLLDFNVLDTVWIQHSRSLPQQEEVSASTPGAQDLSSLLPGQSSCFRPAAPNLAGAVEFSDVKTLLKEWITTISGLCGSSVIWEQDLSTMARAPCLTLQAVRRAGSSPGVFLLPRSDGRRHPAGCEILHWPHRGERLGKIGSGYKIHEKVIYLIFYLKRKKKKHVPTVNWGHMDRTGF